MDEIIKSLSEKFNLSEASVRSAVASLLKLLQDKAAGTEFEEWVGKIPGAASLLASAPAEVADSGKSLLGGLLGAFGGGSDLTKALAALQSSGIPVEKALPFAKEFLNQAREQFGAEKVDGVLNRIPMLKSLLG